MSDLQPNGIKVNLDGQEWHFYMTIAAADVIQDHYDKPLQDVMNMLYRERERYSTCAYILSVLTADEVRRDKLSIKPPTESKIRDIVDVPMANKLTMKILQSYGISMPEKDDDEDDDPNLKRRSPKNSTSRGSSTSA